MKKIILLLLITLTFGSLFSAYLSNVEMNLSQPDGTDFSCLASGDEYFNWLHDENGFTIIQSQKDGFYYYAEKSSGNIVPSEYLVNSVNPSIVGLQKWVKISKEQYLAKKNEMERFDNRNSRVPSTGQINNLVVYIRFADQSEFQNSRSYFDEKFNGDENSLNDYFDEVSYQSLNIDSFHYPESEMDTNLSYQDEHNRGYYLPYNAETNPDGYMTSNQRTQREHSLLVNAIDAIADEIPEDLIIDVDDDGKVDNVCFIIRGNNSAWADLLWAHRWTLHTMYAWIGDKYVYDYTFQPESQNEVSTLSHEMFHVLGAPDLYHYETDGISPYGGWDLMNGSFTHMSAYMKYYYSDWIDEIPEISESGEYWLNPITEPENNCYKVASPYSNFEYFVIEFRKQIAGTYENYLPGSGLTVSRVYSYMEGMGNADGPPDELYLYRPNGSNVENGNLSFAHFSEESGRTLMNEDTNPMPFLLNGDFGGLEIGNVSSAEADSISFVLFPGSGFVIGSLSSAIDSVDFSNAEIVVDDYFNYEVSEDGDFSFEVTQGEHDISISLYGHSGYEETFITEADGIHEIVCELDVLPTVYNLSGNFEDTYNTVTLDWDFEDMNNENFIEFQLWLSMYEDIWNQFQTTDQSNHEFIFNGTNMLKIYIESVYTNGTSYPSEILEIDLTDLDEDSSEFIKNELLGNYPNPFNPTTNISFNITENSEVDIQIFNVKGQKVHSLALGEIAAGNHQVEWQGNDYQGNSVSSGVYLYRLRINQKVVSTKRCLLLK